MTSAFSETLTCPEESESPPSTLLFNSSWVLQSPQEKSTTMVMQNFGGQTTCIMAYVRMVNSEHFVQSLGSSLFRGATVS